MIDRVTPPRDHRLYKLLPTVHQLRDAEQGYPLWGLLSVIGEQVDVVDADLSRLYDNWFIETCDDWVVAYIAELVGFRAGGIDDNEVQLSAEVARKRSRFLFPRRDVGNIVSLRRRKGTLAVLEDMARDSAGWLARAVEFARLTISLPSTHVRTTDESEAKFPVGGTLNFRDPDALDRINGPFEDETTPHLPSVRDYDPLDPSTRYGPNKLGLFVWRHEIRKIERTAAFCTSSGDGWRAFRVHPAGLSVPLHIRPQPEANEFDTAQEHQRPGLLRRLALGVDEGGHRVASSKYYGPDRSLAIWNPGSGELIPRRQVRPGNLDWVGQKNGTPSDDLRTQIAEGVTFVDPTTGTIVSAADQLLVSYTEAAAGPIGGGPYGRRPAYVPPTATKFTIASGGGSVDAKLAESDWFEAISDPDIRQGFPDGVQVLRKTHDPRYLLIEIADSGIYSLSRLAIHLTAGTPSQYQTLHVRAADGCRPMIRINGDACDGGCRFVLGKHTRLILEGLLLDGDGITVVNEAPTDADEPPDQSHRRVEVSHCTFIPCGSCCSTNSGSAGLRTNLSGGEVVISSSILAGLAHTPPDDQTTLLHRPTTVEILDSIVDGQKGNAINGETNYAAYIQNTTVFGPAKVDRLLLAENSIFDGRVTCRNPSEGGMRFCYLGETNPEIRQPRSKTPSRYACQPDLAAKSSQRQPCDKRSTTEVCGDDITDPNHGSVATMKPLFVSRTYGDPGYGQLSEACPVQIRQGAEDQSEMGAFHDQFVPQRQALLQSRLEEFTPLGMESFVIFVN